MTQVLNSFKRQWSRGRKAGERAYCCSPVKIFRPTPDNRSLRLVATATPIYTIGDGPLPESGIPTKLINPKRRNNRKR